MLLTYQNLSICRATQADAETLCRWWNDGAVMAHAGFPHGLNTSAEAIAQSLAADTDSNCRLLLQIDSRPIGEMSYRSQGGGAVEIGVKICEQAEQGKGFGVLYLRMLITYLFRSGYDKIILDTNANNNRAQHVYEKLGFQKLRVNHDSWTNQAGELQSSVDYKLCKGVFAQWLESDTRAM